MIRLNFLTITKQENNYVLLLTNTSSEWAQQSWKNHFPRSITAKKDDVSVGFIGYAELPYLSEYRQKNIAGIYGMNVNPEYRRQDIATSLINYLFNHAHNLGIKEILVGTTVQNTAARRTYEKGGMRPIAFRTGTMYQCRPLAAPNPDFPIQNQHR